jgi:hypothetical protein
LHKIIAYCVNYDPHTTQRYIDRRKQSPISCAKIAEYFPELYDTLNCSCKFDLPPKSYPSPVLYLLESEIEQATIAPFNRRGEKEAKTEKDAPHQKATEKLEEEETVLDFEKVFLEEDDTLKDKTATTDGVLPQAAGQPTIHQKDEAIDDEIEDQASSAEKALCAESNEASGTEEKIMQESAAQIRTQSAGGPSEACDLALRYLNLKHRRSKIDNQLNEVVRQIEMLFRNQNTDVLRTDLGEIKREKDGKLSVTF